MSDACAINMTNVLVGVCGRRPKRVVGCWKHVTCEGCLGVWAEGEAVTCPCTDCWREAHEPPQVTYSCLEVRWIRVRGQSRGAGRTHEDGGLIGRLIEWQARCGIYPIQGLVTGPGIHSALYVPDDALKLEAWLVREGCEEVAWPAQ